MKIKIKQINILKLTSSYEGRDIIIISQRKKLTATLNPKKTKT